MMDQKPGSARLAWPELMKMTALFWIVLNHLAEIRFSYPYIANPASNWPPLADRIAQLKPISGFGNWDVLLNIWRYVGWLGDQGVALFLIASGFGLTWGLLARQGRTPFKISDFYLRRAKRILPVWWGVHVLFIVTFVVAGVGLSPFSLATVLSFVGIRVTPDMLYYFSPAWWYIPLLIQLYLVFPALWYALRRWGPGRLLLVAGGIAFLIRLAGLLYFDYYLDAWSRGAIFITRLPELVLGICFAVWLFEQPEKTARSLKGVLPSAGLIAIYLAGNLLSLTLWGMSVGPFLTGASAFLILYKLFVAIEPRLPGSVLAPFVWIGKHSYSLFLVHLPVFMALVKPDAYTWHDELLRILAAAAITVVLALFLEKAVDIVTIWIGRLNERLGTVKLVAGIAILGSIFIGFFIGAELAVRRFDPQEVAGWGERESLEPHDEFGWRMIPSKTTRLRWESYDYVVTSNSLGFPGPEPKAAKEPNTYRIMVTGDAFTSAEGVNAEQAWPRLMETALNEKVPGKKVEVLNFAMTGYGPNQYQKVIEKYAPVYHPDLIIVETFVNDLQDVQKSNEAFHDSIGFANKPATGIKSIVRLEHLRAWMDLRIVGPLKELITGRPRPHGYFLGNFKALERDQPAYDEGRELYRARLDEMRSTATTNGAKFLIVSIPAPVQVCSESQLAYYPRGVRLSDSETFDTDLPQRTIFGLASDLAVPIFDLRKAFTDSSATCPYQPRNMHWTVSGHQTAANYIAAKLIEDGIIR
ncbi:MAG: acyltransferase family protein [Pyrinomonadaceae bacterium]